MPSAAEHLSVLDEFVRPTRQYADYIRHRDRYASDAQLVLDHHAGGPMLEIGSAPCHSTALLSLLGIEVVGIDIEPGRCASFIDNFGLDVRCADIEREPLPFDDASFTTVLFAETLEHLRVDPIYTMSEINRVLTPDGALLLTTPNFYSAQNIARFLLGRGIGDAYTEFSKLRRLGHMGHVREYNHKEVLRLLDVSGFRTEQVTFKHYYYPRSKRGLFARVAFTLLPKRMRSYQVIVARKTGRGPGLQPLA